MITKHNTTHVWHAATQRAGRIVCATSPHANGSPRVIVEWIDGTESKVCESELNIGPRGWTHVES